MLLEKALDALLIGVGWLALAAMLVRMDGHGSPLLDLSVFGALAVWAVVRHGRSLV
jgi:hypothetical protein